MKDKIEKLIHKALKNLGITKDVNFSIEHPEDLKNGDYSTNVAMICAKSLKINPSELAEKIVERIKTPSASGISPLAGGEKYIERIEVAGPGFINFYLSREFFTKSVENIISTSPTGGENWGKNNLLSGKKIMVEYTDPNPFKPFHIGHLMTNAIGESLSRIVEFSGAETIRANYQGDVGPHVAKAIYHLIKLNYPTDNSGISDFALALVIGDNYVKGNNEYEINEDAKKEIDNINRQIYNYVNKNGECDEKIKKYYDWGRKVTLEAFKEIYKLLGTKFSDGCYFFESAMAPIGEKIVRENIGKAVSAEDSRIIFSESDGAVVFHGEEYDKKLHTRVFINSQGLPTYETKEIGLTVTKFEKENPDLSIVVTATEQAEYMKVVSKAISLIHSDYEKRMKHITHGMMRFADGKMSSRKGNVITGESLLRDSMGMVLDKMAEREMEDSEKNKISEIVGVSALKYSILKSSLGSDIIYDPLKSISFEGDSGPYLQYTSVRANSILNKAKDFFKDGSWEDSLKNRPLEVSESVTDLEKYLYQFPEIVEHSYTNLEPHHIATYLTKLASSFNNFYGNTQILKDDNLYINYQINLIKAFYQTMKNGLWLLGIEVPERM